MEKSKMRGILAKKMRRFVKWNWESLPEKVLHKNPHGQSYKPVTYTVNANNIIVRIPGIPFRYAKKECRKDWYNELKKSYKRRENPTLIAIANWNN